MDPQSFSKVWDEASLHGKLVYKTRLFVHFCSVLFFDKLSLIEPSVLLFSVIFGDCRLVSRLSP